MSLPQNINPDIKESMDPLLIQLYDLVVIAGHLPPDQRHGNHTSLKEFIQKLFEVEVVSELLRSVPEQLHEMDLANDHLHMPAHMDQRGLHFTPQMRTVLMQLSVRGVCDTVLHCIC
jgi:hypothetical protein